MHTKRFVTESELLADACRLGVRVAECGFRPSFIVGPWRGGRAPDFHLHLSDDWLVMPYELNGLEREHIARHKPWLPSIPDSLDAPPGGATSA